MGEELLLGALIRYVDHGTENERQLAQLGIDLVKLTGADERVKKYINHRTLNALEKGEQ
jgi:hypothetical protein